jgi:hypothetical protein
VPGRFGRRPAIILIDSISMRFKPKDATMLFAIATPLVVLLLAAAASFVITRPVGNLRRYIGASLSSLLLAAAGVAAAGANVYGSASQHAIVMAVAAAFGFCIGSLLAWRRRTLPNMRGKLEAHARRTKRASSQWHDHVARRA